LDEIQTKVFRFFSLLFTVPYSFAGDFFFFKITQPLTVATKEKGGKPDKKPYPLPYGLRIHTERLCPETSMKLYVHQFGKCPYTNVFSMEMMVL
jgi:hypothetical protein